MAIKVKRKKYVETNMFHLLKEYCEKCTGESKTVPNMSMTVKELILKHSQGIAPAVMKKALYEMDDFGEELNPLRKQGFDLTDIDKMSREVKAAYKVVQMQKAKEREEEDRKEKARIADEYMKENKLGPYADQKAKDTDKS